MHQQRLSAGNWRRKEAAHYGKITQHNINFIFSINTSAESVSFTLYVLAGWLAYKRERRRSEKTRLVQYVDIYLVPTNNNNNKWEQAMHGKRASTIECCNAFKVP